jgi:DNA-binding MarR family transcriptional regulator
VSGAARAAQVAALSEQARVAASRGVLFHAAVASAVGINVTDVTCLGLLDKNGPMSAGRLAEAVGLSRGGAITAAIDRLERAGFVRRRRADDDRRQVLVELRPDGSYQRLTATFAALGDAYRELIESYSDRQLAVLLDFTEKANAILDDQTRRLRG